MKRTFLQLACALLLTCVAFGQSKTEGLQFTYGEDIPDESGKIVEMIGESSGKVYALNLQGKDNYALKIFDAAKLKLLATVPIQLPEVNDRELEFENVSILDGKLYLLGSAYYRRDKKYCLIGIPIQPDGKPAKEMITLFETPVENKSNKGDFYFKEAPDRKHLGVMQVAFFDKEDMMQYDMKLFDSKLNIVFATTDKVKVDDEDKKDYEFTIADFDTNINGDISMVINESWRDRKKKEKNEKFELRVFKAANKYKLETINLDITGKEVINCKLFANSKNMLQATGFYSSVRDNGKANKELKGIYIITIDLNSNRVVSAAFNEFDYDTKVKLLGERRAKKGKDLKPLYSIRSIIEREDGGLLVLSEYAMIVVGRSQGFGPLSVTPITYTTNEVIVNSINPDGTMAWSGVVPKEQVVGVTSMGLTFSTGSSSGNFSVGMSIGFPLGVLGKGPEFIGFIPIYKDNKLRILYNDNPKNAGVTVIDDLKTMNNPNKAVPVVFEFDAKGQMTRKDLGEAAKEELSIRTQVYDRTDYNHFLIYASRRSVDKIGRLTVD